MLGDHAALRRHLPTALVVLDWNGTTMDDAHRTLASLNATLAELGIAGIDADTFSARFRLPMAAMLADLGVAEGDLDAAIRSWNGQIGHAEATLSRGAEALLRGLAERGRPGGVISAAAAPVVERDAAALGILPHLRFLIGDANPKSEPLRELVALGEGPVVYVGDTEYDVTEAIAAGAVPVGFSGGYRPAEALLAAGALAVIDDLAELLGDAVPARIPSRDMS